MFFRARKNDNMVRDSVKTKEDWMNLKWRPAMGWMYMIVCFSDFVAFPILWTWIQTAYGGQIWTPWSPITLHGAGLFHIAMGAVLGIAAWESIHQRIGSTIGNVIADKAKLGSKPESTDTPEPIETNANNKVDIKKS